MWRQHKQWLAAVAVLLVGCGGPKPSLRWVDDATFVAPRATIIDNIRLSLGADEHISLRIAAALDHNCPLESVSVSLERRMSSAEPRFVLDVCGFEHTYMELDGSVFLDVTEKLAAPAPAPTQPSGLDAPTSPPTTSPATDQKPKEPAK